SVNYRVGIGERYCARQSGILIQTCYVQPVYIGWLLVVKTHVRTKRRGCGDTTARGAGVDGAVPIRVDCVRRGIARRSGINACRLAVVTAAAAGGGGTSRAVIVGHVYQHVAAGPEEGAAVEDKRIPAGGWRRQRTGVRVYGN